jgi:hypothetical protein
MLGDGKWNSGDQGSFYKYQFGVLKLLDAINNGIAALPGVDYESRTTRYEVIAGPTPPGAGYAIGQFLVRYDIINVTTGAVTVTVWFNQSLQTTLVGAGNPNPADLTPVSGSLSVTVLNPFNLEATQLAVLAALGPLATAANQTALNALITTLNGLVSTAANQVAQTALLTTIDADTSNLDVLLSTRATEATLSTLNSRFTPVSRTPSLTRAVVAGAVAAGARSVSVYNAGTTAGVWLGASIEPGEQFSYDAGGQGDTLGAFAYTASATAILVITTVV